MKKTGTRLLTLIMALVMALSCTMFASAADVAEATEENIMKNDMCVLLSTNGYTELTPIKHATGVSTAYFNLDGAGGTVYLAIASNVRVNVKITNNDGKTVAMWYADSTGGDSKLFNMAPNRGEFAGKPWQSGKYYTWITTDSAGSYTYQFVRIT